MNKHQQEKAVKKTKELIKLHTVSENNFTLKALKELLVIINRLE